MGARATGMVLAGGAALFAAGFVLGRWTSVPAPPPAADGGSSPESGTVEAPVAGGASPRAADSSGGSAGVSAGSAPASSPGTVLGAEATSTSVETGGRDAASAPGAREAGIPGRKVTDVNPSSPAGGLVPPPARGADAPGRVEPPAPYALPERIRGRLLDSFTGQPVPGSRVDLLWELGDGTMSGGVATAMPDAEGCFSIEPREEMRGTVAWVLKERVREGKYRNEEDVLADVDYTLRAAAKGYVTEEIGDPGPAVEVRIDPEGRDRLTGSIRVDARWPDGVRYGGRLLVEAGSHDRPGFSQWALPDADGTFLLVGVAPGRWGLRVAGREHSGEEILVPETGEARILLRVPRTGVQEPGDAPKGEPREVEVSTGARDPGRWAFVRAEARPGLFFRSEVVASAARFPALPAGKWTFVLQAAERPEESFAADVPPGPGPFRLSFPEPAPEVAAPK